MTDENTLTPPIESIEVAASAPEPEPTPELEPETAALAQEPTPKPEPEPQTHIPAYTPQQHASELDAAIARLKTSSSATAHGTIIYDVIAMLEATAAKLKAAMTGK